jgi:signal transduction histidine kinase
MLKKKFQWDILTRVLLLFITLTIAAYLLVKGLYIYDLLIAPVILYQVYDFYRFHRQAETEVEQFVESIHYRDFSRNFNVKNAPFELQPLREGFNQINSTFKLITREKETQFQYLQKILELVDTGILSYEMETGEVVWINESLKRMLQVPYLPTIHSLEKRKPLLYEQLLGIQPGNNVVLSIPQEKHLMRVVVSATAFQTDGKTYKLMAFQNVNEALDETESRAWQRLLSVMTHEIMNSVAPISSLADTLQGRLRESLSRLDNTDGLADDLDLGIATIKKRSEGLLKFAEVYRNLNKITQPNLKRVMVRDLFENMYNLMEPTLVRKNIELDIVLKETGLAVDLDINLVEQVLINLIVNAMDAVKDQAQSRIVLSAEQLNRRVVIKVADNGSGMSEEVMANVFVPFFSTKKNGSGIGLSLCKQIMMLHKGTITVQSVEGQGTVFVLQF